MSKKEFEKQEIGGVSFQYLKGKGVTITIGKEKRTIPKNDLWMIVFMNSKGKTQDQLVPVWQKDMMQFVRQYEIVAKKDMKAGDKLTFHANIDVPKVVVESLLKKEGVLDPVAHIAAMAPEKTPAQ